MPRLLESGSGFEPGREHELVRAYRRSGELAQASRMLAAPPAELGGLVGGALAFFLAAWKDPRTPGGGGPCLVVTATQEEADEVQEEIAVLGGLPALPFPAWESLLVDAEPDGEIYRQRLEVLVRLVRFPLEPLFIVAPVQALLQPAPPPRLLAEARLGLRVGEAQSPEALAGRLVRCGFRAAAAVEARGEFSRRGDILDFFPYQGEYPLRLEFFGDVLDSAREFRPENQRTVAGSEKEAVEVLLLRQADVFRPCCRGADDPLLLDYLGEAGRVFVKEPRAVVERAEKILHNLLGEEAGAAGRAFQERMAAVTAANLTALAAAGGAAGLTLRFLSVERYRSGEVSQVCAALAARLASGSRLEVYCENPAEAKRFEEILQDNGLAAGDGLRVRVGPLRSGFEVGELNAAFLTTREIFGRRTIRRLRRRPVASRPIDNFLQLERGDHVVHLAHGVGRYLGMEFVLKDGIEQEFLVLEFREQVKLFVPVSKADLVQRYIGSDDRPPVLDRIGGVTWSRKKEQVEAALLDLASDLLEVQAMRQQRPGPAYPTDSEWQRQFEAAFPFEDTPDQVEVTEAIKADLRSPRPMDRLICGDVGYGKTELAMRAAFKVVDSGKQVAMLVPTTVLAQQHYRTFRERLAEFPVTVEVLSRFRTPAEQKAVIAAAAAGKVDVLIGTHRLLSDDIAFRDLGLVIIDEEQRFGVLHKEKLKRLRSTVDILTLSATPIPRTLHMALLGIRDISSLTTAPEGRSPVHTEVAYFEPLRVREIVIRELNRDGQVYFVHNRVHDIEAVTLELEKIVPEARIEYGHGQMNEHELEEKMVRFVEGRTDILVATTIIESGIDIPNVNTIFIDEADRYGLADLHQLRGRVGRYKHQAYCYLLLPTHRHVNPDAQKRLQALVEFSNLGAGFQIALRDLEIRGAGNILGPEQSGHIALVGYDTYCRLLKRAVERLKDAEAPEPVQVEIDLAREAYLPESYLGDENRRLEVYRRLSQAATAEAVADLEAELEDRFGPPPPPLVRLLEVQRLRVLCAAKGVEYLGRDGQHLILRGRESMRKLLESCPARVAVLDATTAAVLLDDGARRDPAAITDEDAFRVALEWLKSGVYPSAGFRRGARGTPAGGVAAGRR